MKQVVELATVEKVDILWLEVWEMGVNINLVEGHLHLTTNWLPHSLGGMNLVQQPLWPLTLPCQKRQPSGASLAPSHKIWGRYHCHSPVLNHHTTTTVGIFILLVSNDNHWLSCYLRKIVDVMSDILSCTKLEWFSHKNKKEDIVNQVTDQVTCS